MPFELQADGPYFNLLDFFGRLSRLSRIINVGDIDFEDAPDGKAAKYTLRPGTSVSAYFQQPRSSPSPLSRFRNHSSSTGRGKTAVRRSAETVNGMSELCVL